MQEPINVEIRVTKQVFLWFVPYQASDPEILNKDNNEGTFNVVLNHNFDFEKPEKGKWLMHIDIELNVIPLAKIKARTSFQVSCSEEILISPESLDMMNKIAIQGAEKGFFEQCKVHNITTTLTKIANPEDFVNGIRDSMKNQYYIRKKSNSTLPKKDVGAVELTTGYNTLLLTQGTFIILDNVLHINKLFDLSNNQKVFHSVIPEPVYYTIKMTCSELSEKKINLVFLHIVYFQICLDCAIQLLLDKHAQTLQPAIIEAGLTPKVQKEFIEFGSGILRQFRKDYKTGGSKIENLEIRYDWNSLIK